MLTNKGKYGLKAMVHLAGLEPGRPALVSDIALQNGLPKKFLDTILGELRNAGFVQSKKGRGGGYVLARPAHQIRVGHVIRALDGPLAPFPCASRTSYRRCNDCADEERCAVRLMMLEVRSAISSVLDNRSLADMRGMAEIDIERLMYHI
ncbi:MAG: Rrf2 family transcriptional regulator [Methylobacteriaceae bacterium]|nr:Rrf2 family transcriptional regulator [Methylobacteriaceae bacterium]